MISPEKVLKLPSLWDLTVMPKALNDVIPVLDRLLVDHGSAESIEVDLSGVERLDSAGLVGLIELQRRAGARGSRLRWHAIPENLQELVLVYGLSAWFAEASPAKPDLAKSIPANPNPSEPNEHGGQCGLA
ncbi:MAG TPA: hypothetical protein DCE31_08615 [Lautropia sp.]|nr:hypothetical protein [Lautropia sp.]